MSGFPPITGNQTHLGNWREPGHSRWSFRHVRELVPSAGIRPSQSPLPLAVEGRDVGNIRFAGPDGKTRSIREFFTESASDGMIVLKRGRIAAEWYAAGCKADEPHLIFSISKSVTALIAAMLEEQGLLDPEAPVVEYVPEVKGSAYERARVRHVLDMTVGIEFEESYLKPDSPFARYREAMGWNLPAVPGRMLDLRSFLTSLPPDGKAHGEVFHYVSPNSDLLGFIVERAGGRRFHGMMEEWLWQPMGAEHDAYITVDRLGAPRTAGGICVSLRDLARLGEVMRGHGAANGRQVVPGRFIDELYSKGERGPWLKGDLLMLAPDGHYRNQWYVTGPGGAMMGVGIHGQWLYADPKSEITIAKLSCQDLPVDDPMDQLCLAAFKAITEALT